MKIHHVAVCVHDLAKAENFYKGVLNLPEDRRWFYEDGSLRSIWLRIDGCILMIEPAAPGAQRRGDHAEGWYTVALDIPPEDRASWLARFQKHGVPVIQESDYSIYVQDPEGNRVALTHWPVASK